MSIRKIHLNKLLKAFALPDNDLISLLRTDIRMERAKKNGTNSNGGDFHASFWYDAKGHVAGSRDLREATEERIKSHNGRKRLYPILCEGFLNWWDNKRRWRNEPFNIQPIAVKTQYEVEELNAVIKVENLLGLSIGENDNRLIYPYHSEDPELFKENGRLGLWLLSTALSEHNEHDMRILDIIRSNSFSVADLPFQGNERAELVARFRKIINKWEELKSEY